MGRERFPAGASITLDQLAGDCHPHLARLRSSEPVSWIPALGGWLVTGRHQAIEVMRDSETFTVDDPRFSTARVIGPSMLSLDGADHVRHRQPFVDPFRAGAIRQSLSTWLADRARSLIDDIKLAGRADLRATVAAPLAIDTMKRILGLTRVDAAELLSWYDGIVGSVDAVTKGEAAPESGREAFEALRRATVDHLDGSPLLTAVRAGGDLTVNEVVSNVAVLLFGGVVTTESSIATAFLLLLADPAVLAEVRSDRSLLAGAIEETFRMEPSAAVVDRYATAPISLGGAEIGAGDLVRVSLTGANRDPAAFADPDTFDLRRPSQHVAFARGPHACLGIHLARHETAAAVGAALDGLPDLALEGAPEPVRGLVFRAPVTVNAAWNPFP